MNVGRPRWSSTNASGPPGRPGRRQPQHGRHHVGAVLAAHPRRAHDGGRRPERRGLALAGELRRAVHRQRVRLVPLAVRPVERAVEHVVGARRGRGGRRRRRSASASQRTARALAANARSGSPSQASTAVHAAELTTTSGRTVVISAEHGVAVGDVERRRVERRRRRRRPRVAVRDDVVAELPAGARDEQPHQNAARALSGSHQSRWSRYHSTVRRQRVVEVVLGLPAERGDLVDRDRVAPVVAEPVGDRLDVALVAPGQLEQPMRQLDGW